MSTRSIDFRQRQVAWLMGGDTGLSSRFLFRALEGVESLQVSWPHDADDFGRCYRMLEALPEWRRKLRTLHVDSVVWRRLLRIWDRLTKLYENRQYVEICSLIAREEGWR